MKKAPHIYMLFALITTVYSTNLSGQSSKVSYDIAETVQSDSIVYFPLKSYDFGIPNPNADKSKQQTHISVLEDVATLRQQSPAITANLSSSGRTLQIDTTKSIGKIPYSEGVSPSGARTYTIPIPTPAAAKYARQVYLYYDSQAGNGIVGYGWELGGLSQITLADKNIYYHGVDMAAQASDTDRVFYIDGVPLIPNSDGILANIYPLISAKGYILAKANYNGSNICTFDVAYPDGSKATYGYSTTDKLVNSYQITSAEDRNGNRVEYQWTTINNAPRLTRVEYFNNGIQSPVGVIKFSYKSRTDYITKYRVGINYSQRYLLEGIEVLNDGNSLIAYVLNHENEAETNLLTSIECKSADKELNPLKFHYGVLSGGNNADFHKEDQIFLSSFFNNTGDQEFIYRRGKFLNGKYSDGLVILPNFSTYGAIAVKNADIFGWTKYTLYGSTYSADQTILIAPSLSYISEVYKIKAEEGLQYIDVADIDNDGIDEIIKVNNIDINAARTHSISRITIYECNDTGVSVQKSFNVEIYGVFNSGNTFYSPWERCFLLGDFIGDGTVQLWTSMFNRDPTGYPFDSFMNLIDLNAGTKLAETYLFSLSDEDYANGYLFCTDMDADSKTELCHATSSGLNMYEYRGNMFMLKKTYSTIKSSFLSNGYKLTDLNADGYTDIAIEPPTGSPIMRTYSYNGNTFIESTSHIAQKNEGDEYMYFDANNDGLPDLIQKTGTKIYFYLNKNGKIDNSTRKTSYITLGQNADLVPCSAMDFGDMSHFITVEGAYINLYTFSQNLAEDRCLTRFIDSYGKTTVNHYKDISQSYGSTYLIDQDRTYNSSEGFSRTVFPLQVLYDTQTYLSPECLDSGLLSSLYYTYYDAVNNSQGLGFCGFGGVRTIDFMGETDKEPVTYTTYDPEMAGAVKRIDKSFSSSQDEPYETTIYALSTYLKRFGEQDPKPIIIINDNKISGINTRSQIQYNIYGYPIRIRNIINANKISKDILNTYNNSISESIYILGSTKATTITYHKKDDTSKQDTLGGKIPSTWRERTSYTYDSRMRPLSKKISVRPTTGSYLAKEETLWEYDKYGNIISEKHIPYNSGSAIGTSYTYDSSGKYVIEQTDKFGCTTTFADYNKFGKPETVTDHMDRITYYEYDVWGNAVSQTNPDGSTETVEYKWSTGPGIFFRKTSNSLKPSEYIEYDASGKEIKTGTMRHDGKWVYTDKEYGNNGKLHRVSCPYIDNAILWNTYEYDEYSRQLAYTGASSETIRWEYDGLSTTETKNDWPITKTIDYNGNLTKITEPTGEIVYSLRPDGQPQQISVTGGSNIIFSYDAYGNRYTISDPSAGIQKDTISYYQDGSSFALHTNPHGTIGTYIDKFGRVTLKTITGEYDTQYTYSSDNPSLLISEVSSNGVTKNYTYDCFDRIVSIKETVPDGKWLEQTYSYTVDGKLASIKYESQSGEIATEEYAYSNGHNTVISVNSIPVMQLNASNELMQPLSVTTGTINRTYSYSSTGMPSRRTMGNVMDMSYQFNSANGNLMNRTNNLNGKTEDFNYDPVNRIVMMGDRFIHYLDNGNIMTMDGVGDLHYDDIEHPYRVTSLRTSENIVPAAPQQISYTSYWRPSQLNESGINASFTYDADGDRVKMRLSTGVTEILSRYYIGDRYEIDITSDGTVERLYLGGDAYNAPMVYIRENDDAWTLYNIGRDYLGNITHIATADGSLIAEYSYDPWGRLRDPETLEIYSPGEEPELFLGRGYSGHEHLTDFGLINMNARLYDPVLCRFLSPDPYIQDSESIQGFNRYTYCRNNPLMYNDKSGEIIGTAIAFIYDFFKTVIQGGLDLSNLDIMKNAWEKFDPSASWSRTNKAWQIFEGAWWVSPGTSSEDRDTILKSRWGYEFIQSFYGLLASHIYNLAFDVDVSRFYDATVVNRQGSGNGSGFTLGPYINTKNAGADLIRHEYGHVLQSRDMGPGYLFVVGLPSLVGSALDMMGLHDHDREWYEVDANIRAKNYVSTYDPQSLNTEPWKFDKYPTNYNNDWYYPISIMPGGPLVLALLLGYGYIL